MELFRISFKAEEIYTQVLSEAIEKVSLHHQMGTTSTMRLRLSIEELLSYLSQTVHGETVDLGMSGTSLGMHISLTFQVDTRVLRYFNSVIDESEFIKDEETITHLELLLAAKFVDDYSMELLGDKINITLTKEREFSRVESKKCVNSNLKIANPGQFEINSDSLEEVSAYIQGHYSELYYNDDITKPRRILAEIELGLYDYTTAFDSSGKPLGFMYWSKKDSACYEFFGPYVFDDRKEELSKLLCNEMVQKCAKSNAYFLISEKATNELPSILFEALESQNGTLQYRQLKEDVGAGVWSSQKLRSYLHQTYEELMLFRDIKEITDMDTEQNEYSVFSIAPDHVSSQVTLIPYLPGKDADRNIKLHVKTLRSEGYENIRIRLDLFEKWQAQLADICTNLDFTPLLVKPFGSKSDVLIMQYNER
jgi:hypothetical protein